MPEATRTGRSGRRPSTARLTQSDGVPFTEKRRSAIWVTRRGRCRVNACPTALCSRSGATTYTSPRSSRAAARAASPAAWTPSSLVTRITGGIAAHRSSKKRDGRSENLPWSLLLKWSGRLDLNQRPLDPQTHGAASTAPLLFQAVGCFPLTPQDVTTRAASRKEGQHGTRGDPIRSGSARRRAHAGTWPKHAPRRAAGELMLLPVYGPPQAQARRCPMAVRG